MTFEDYIKGMNKEQIKKISEHMHQVFFVAWFKQHYPYLIYAIPNGGLRNKVHAMKLKAEGVLAGIPDLEVPELNLYIEMKTIKGKLSPAQKQVIPKLEQAGCTVLICYGYYDAVEKIKNFIDNITP